jgi:TolA-binding protein/TolB-like protein
MISARADAADGKIRIGVAAFGSKADGISDSQAAIITDLFTFDLTQSKTISVIERESIDKIGQELKLGMSGLIDPMTAAEIGKVAGVKYMLLGSITQVDQKASGGGFLIVGTSSHEMRATVDMRVVDVSTAEIVMALRADGTAKNDSTAFSYGGFSHVESEFGGIQARAIADAVSKLSAEVRGVIGGEHPRVVSATSDGFALDIAAPKAGALYLVYVDGKTIYGLDGEVIGKDKLPIAILKVSAVNVGYSVANVVPQGGSPKNVQRGDKLEPISQARAKELIPKMPKERPRTSGSAADALLGGDGKQAIARTPDENGGDPEPAESVEPAKTEEPAEEVAPAAAPKESKPTKPAAEPKVVDGVDPNTTTDAKLIGTFPLSQGDRNMLGIQHRNAFKLYSAKRYKDALELFSKLSDDYDCNYLSAYWAGMTSLKMKDKKTAAEWFDRALSVNPNYEPAKKEREKL